VLEGINWKFRSLSNAPQIRLDSERIKEILKIDPEVLCKAQNRA
jgi:hypothetical protein